MIREVRRLSVWFWLAALASSGFSKPPIETQARLETLAKNRGGGLAVAWVDGDGAAFFCTGKFSRRDQRPITPDTPFEIASLTKVFTALLLAETERAGRVRRDDPVAKYLLPADDPAHAALRRITLHSLTTHTSGLPRTPADFPKSSTVPNPYGAFDRAHLVGTLRQFGPDAPTGREAAYSNVGVALLGEALGEAWGTSFAEALSTQVLQPMGLAPVTLATTGVKLPALLPPGHNRGEVISPWTFRAYAPAAGMVMSARELGGFLQFCLGRGDVPLRRALRETVQPQVSAPRYAGEIGLGWFIRGLDRARLYWHSGQIGGFSSYMAVWPVAGKAIAVLGNDAASPEAIALALWELKIPPAAGINWLAESDRRK